MNDPEDLTSFDFTSLLRTCRFLDQCTLILEVDGCRTCEFACGGIHDTDDPHNCGAELSGTGTSSPEPAVTPEEGADPTLPLESTIDG
jgi:hypothetical protein